MTKPDPKTDERSKQQESLGLPTPTKPKVDAFEHPLGVISELLGQVQALNRFDRIQVNITLLATQTVVPELPDQSMYTQLTVSPTELRVNSEMIRELIACKVRHMVADLDQVIDQRHADELGGRPCASAKS